MCAMARSRACFNCIDIIIIIIITITITSSSSSSDCIGRKRPGLRIGVTAAIMSWLCAVFPQAARARHSGVARPTRQGDLGASLRYRVFYPETRTGTQQPQELHSCARFRPWHDAEPKAGECRVGSAIPTRASRPRDPTVGSGAVEHTSDWCAQSYCCCYRCS